MGEIFERFFVFGWDGGGGVVCLMAANGCAVCGWQVDSSTSTSAILHTSVLHQMAGQHLIGVKTSRTAKLAES